MGDRVATASQVLRLVVLRIPFFFHPTPSCCHSGMWQAKCSVGQSTPTSTSCTCSQLLVPPDTCASCRQAVCRVLEGAALFATPFRLDIVIPEEIRFQSSVRLGSLVVGLQGRYSESSSAGTRGEQSPLSSRIQMGFDHCPRWIVCVGFPLHCQQTPRPSQLVYIMVYHMHGNGLRQCYLYRRCPSSKPTRPENHGILQDTDLKHARPSQQHRPHHPSQTQTRVTRIDPKPPESGA